MAAFSMRTRETPKQLAIDFVITGALNRQKMSELCMGVGQRRAILTVLVVHQTVEFLSSQTFHIVSGA